MIDFILLILVSAFFLVVPGFLTVTLLLARRLSFLEVAVASVPVSFVITTTILLVMPYAGLTLTALNVSIIFGFLTLTLLTLCWRKRVTFAADLFYGMSRFYRILFFVLFLAMIIAKTFYFINTIFPTATDLGHHMYWSQWIIQEGRIPLYEKTIVDPLDPEQAATSPAAFVGVERIPDFIIGEHLIFSAVSLLSGVSVVSSMPSLLLYLVQIVTILLVFVSLFRFFKRESWGPHAALWSIFLLGVLWSFSGAQAKFVSGGVVGNIFGNMLILSSIYFFFIALTEQSKRAFFFGLWSNVVLVYTHHLSTFIFAYVLLAFILSLLIFVPARMHLLRRALALFWAPYTLLFFIGLGLFFFFVHIPSYINPEAISSSVGTPTKSTRTGLPLAQLMEMAANARYLLAIAGMLALMSVAKKVRTSAQGQNTFIAIVLCISWFAVITLMVLYPQYLQVNILSTRVATYIAYPAVFLSSIALALLLLRARTLPRYLYIGLGMVLFFFVAVEGIPNNIASLRDAPAAEEAVQTFHTARYIGAHLPQDQWALKDHNYITADTWMKIFMPRDYSNPLSRAFFARYESQPRRENCTREMITNPHTELAKVCFDNLSIGPIAVDTKEDGVSFSDQAKFTKVYENNEVSVFWRKTK